MIRVRRHWAFDRYGCFNTQDEMRSPGHMALMSRVRGFKMKEWQRDLGRVDVARAVVVLEGWYDVAWGGEIHRMNPGDVVFANHWWGVRGCDNAEDAMLLCLVVPSDEAMEGRGGVEALPPERLAGLEALVDVLGSSIGDAYEHEQAIDGWNAFAQAAQALSLSVPANDPLFSMVDEGTLAELWQTAQVFARLTSQLQERPDLEDLADAIGMPPRLASERVVRWQRMFSSPKSGWRSYLSAVRVEIAIALFMRGDVPNDEIAGFLGYGSVQAMYHALSRAGFSSPRAEIP